MACGFVPNLRAYLHEDTCVQAGDGEGGMTAPADCRPCMIVVPGGGYEYAAGAEADPVARHFYEEGFQVFVLTYSADPLKRVPLRLQPMRDLARAIRKVRAGAQMYRCSPDRLVVCGFSAGAHLCGSVCVHYKDLDHPHRKGSDYIDPDLAFADISCRPDAAFLCYPVITTGEYAHRGSVHSLLGGNPSEEESRYFSLETQVSQDTPPCFLWHTATDDSVPMENSLLFAMALKKAGIPFAYHVFSYGRHGISLANEVWARGHFAESYTYEHASCILQAIEDGKLEVTEEERSKIDALAHRVYDAQEPIPEASAWPALAIEWLRSIHLL